MKTIQNLTTATAVALTTGALRDYDNGVRSYAATFDLVDDLAADAEVAIDDLLALAGERL
jgi:hypothetical protein